MINKEKYFTLSDEEIWLRDTMVRLMDNLVNQLNFCPLYRNIDNDWASLKVKLGLERV